ncbi:MAG: excinuclease ABC subunit UvrB [Candidatus Aminicenantes bacterium]|nr:excinuclease ABC subunit UvrB [Candidatus Aminicenantes bacterium]
MNKFVLRSEFTPQGDQGRAIEALAGGLAAGARHQVLMGVTGSGKTFTMANLIARAQRPVLVISHNKTLAAQLYQEFRGFFPESAVEYFVSYYDYYQPEAYLPSSNTYIAKEATINDEIDRLRLCATNSLFERRDVIIVASVSCIYGIGAPETYYAMTYAVETGQSLTRKSLLDHLVEIQYERQEDDFKRGGFRVRGDIVDVFPSYAEAAVRFEIEDNRVRAISNLDPLLGTPLGALDKVHIHPRTFFSTPAETLRTAVAGIEQELKDRIAHFQGLGKFVEAERIEERTLYDLEMLREFGYCPGIENYSRFLSGRSPGEPPFTLLDYFPDDFLTIIDESHVTVPQVGGMYQGDRARKLPLIEHGFRLPSALDNRPLNFAEFEARVGQVVAVSATPGPYELKKAEGRIAEQIIRPTGLTDPELEVRPIRGQVDDLFEEIRARTERGERTLITTLTKKMAENLTRYYHERGLRVRYLHSDIETLERVKILRDLRKGVFDVLIGINLLREGLDLPEVSLVAILDADKEGFLRSTSALIQTFGRAARNVSGKALLYADVTTESMRRAIQETDRRRAIQEEHNRRNGITPQSIRKRIDEVMTGIYKRDYLDTTRIAEEKDELLSPQKRWKKIEELETLMRRAARNLEFEKAAKLRDEIKTLKKRELEIGL